MKLVHACLAGSTLALVAACSGGAPPQGAWKCEGEMMGAKQTLETTYAAGGKTSGKGQFVVDQPAAKMDIKLTYTGTWKLEGDQLTEQMTEPKITEATMNGQPLPEEMMSAMVQGMGDPQTSTMKVEGGVMTLSNPGMTTTCKK